MSTVIKLSTTAGRALALSILLGLFLSFVEPAKNYTQLVYNKCSSDAVPDSGDASNGQELDSLLNDLVSHALQSKFYKTTAGNAGVNHSGISGLFQCNRNLTGEDCHGCVTRLQELSTRLCNKAATARIQLSGCFLKYETVTEFSAAKDQKIPGVGVRRDEEYKECSCERAEGEGFEEERDAAFEELEHRMEEGEGECQVEREGLRAEAECEEDMEVDECCECVHRAAEIAKEECERSASGQVYLDGCALKYEYEEYRRQEEGGGGEGYNPGCDGRSYTRSTNPNHG